MRGRLTLDNGKKYSIVIDDSVHREAKKGSEGAMKEISRLLKRELHVDIPALTIEPDHLSFQYFTEEEAEFTRYLRKARKADKPRKRSRSPGTRRRKAQVVISGQMTLIPTPSPIVDHLRAR